MTRYHALFIYGLVMIITGVLVASLGANPLSMLQYIIATGMFLSSILAFYTAYACKNFQVPMKYHALHGVGMLILVAAILIYATNIEKFYLVTISFFYYYGMTEIVFCLQLLMFKDIINLKTLAIRCFIGFLVIIGAIAVSNISTGNPRMAISMIGIVFIFIGINVILYKTVLKRLEKTF